ncbi:hypothetical protein [Acidihalobacter prosperus]|uniref:Uncharacterized protein n=1 Tax=Acidihalobacter prosperus TaxID=160660 RepID=A0A1A6C336_9GAMM|nr:hypothetical protein [Acidihalobacter prosperus]OBS08969.1 hypothetical protein Thpro_022086 [Acidihalobacter prosperus]
MLSEHARKHLDAAKALTGDKTSARASLERLPGRLPRLPEQRTSRKAAWNRIQQEAPDVAELIQEVSSVFGKLAGLRVVIRGETIVDTTTKPSKYDLGD